MSEEKVIKKTNFFKEMLKSIKDLDKYEDFALEDPKKAFKYAMKLILLIACIIAIFYTYQIINNSKTIYSELKEVLPNYTYKDGELSFESDEPISINKFANILIDTNADDEKIKEYENNEDIEILVLKDRLIITSGTSTTGQINYKYADLLEEYNITEFTKQEAEEKIENINMISIIISIYFVIFIWIFILYFLSTFMDILMLSVIAYLVARISKIKFKYAPAFSIAVHSITLSVLLNAIYVIVNLFTGFNIKYFSLMYYTISYIYVVVGILMIKTDLINRQVELIKIAKEQEKIKEETKNDEQKKEEKKEEQPKEKEEEKKKNKNKNKKQKNEDDDINANAHAYKQE